MNRSTALALFAAAVVCLTGITVPTRRIPTPAPPAGVRLAEYRPAVPGIHGLVAAGHPLAAMAGLQMLMKGGNAVDAAVAVGAVMNMMGPQMNGIGGNGFMTIFDRKTGTVYSLSMAGAAPKAIRADRMTPASLDWGIDAGIVPGVFGGYLVALERFGTMSLKEVFAPAIDYAEHGYPIDPSLASGIAMMQSKLAEFPTTAKLFMPDGRPLQAGELFRNPGLAETLRRTVEAEQQALKQGRTRGQAIEAAYDRFYKGDIAQEIDRFMRAHHGALTAADLAAYRPTWQEPVHTTYRGYDVYSNPPTSRGGLELTMQLNLVEGFDLAKYGPESAEALHLEMEAIKLAKADIYRYVADPAFTKMPMTGLLSKSYAARRRRLIDLHHAMTYPAAGDPARFVTPPAGIDAFLRRPPVPSGPAFADRYPDERDTTNYDIVDGDGNAVSCTPTLGNIFGAGVVIGDTGIILNDGMRLGSTSPYPDNVNYVRGGQIPLLNNSPTIVLKDGRLKMVFGSPGGETIGQTEFQMLVNVLDFHLPVQRAVEAPRFALVADPNFYRPGATISVRLEDRVPPDVRRTLEAWGHHLAVTSNFTAAVGGMQAIVVNLKNGTMLAGADPRRTGYAVGW